MESMGMVVAVGDIDLGRNMTYERPAFVHSISRFAREIEEIDK